MTSSYDFYDYIGYWKNRNFEDNCERIVIEKIFQQIPKKEKIIDIGGGYGRLASTYINYFKYCLIVDPSINLVKKGKQLYKGENIKFLIGSLPNLPVKDNSYDCAIMVRVLHHIKDPLPAFKEVNRILKGEGYFILEFANKINFLARLKAFLRRDSLFKFNLESVDRRSENSIREKKISFLNHHPKVILEGLQKSEFQIISIYSVSNLRSTIIKKIVPTKILLKLESIFQNLFAQIFFGPSIFVVTQKIPNKSEGEK